MENNIGKLALALSKAQGKISHAKKDTSNPFFKSKYANLASVWEACRTALSENEIAVIQAPEIVDGVMGIRTKLMHSSGEFETSFLPIAAPLTAKAQEMGSAITYARRYSLSAMVGVAPDDDDDGNQAKNGQTTAKPSVDDRFNDFWIAVANSPGLTALNSVVAKGAILTSELAKTDKDKHEKLLAFIGKRREELEAGENQ
jgi:hypothetical protein